MAVTCLFICSIIPFSTGLLIVSEMTNYFRQRSTENYSFYITLHTESRPGLYRWHGLQQSSVDFQIK